jgi:hypothetical protein
MNEMLTDNVNGDYLYPLDSLLSAMSPVSFDLFASQLKIAVQNGGQSLSG